MTEHDDIREPQEGPTGPSLFDDPTPEAPGSNRPDPRLRPPDPAGTRPKFDPDDLIPKGPKRLLAGHTAALGAGAPAGDAVLLPEREDEAPLDEGPRESRFAPRFQFLFGALLAVAAAAIVFTVAVLVHDDTKSTSTTRINGPAWSTWAPHPGGDDAPTQIADHVAKEYRLPDDKQLVLVTGGPLEVEVASGVSLPLTVAMRNSSGDIKLFNGDGVLYRMCGLGPKCSISEGKPSQRRHLLLRREALELALYSFRYLPVDETVVFLPPPKGKDPSQALFFRRSDADLRNAVVRPLDATLTGQTPSVNGVAKSPDAQLVQDITMAKLFHFSLTPANQEARAFLVLDPLK